MSPRMRRLAWSLPLLVVLGLVPAWWSRQEPPAVQTATVRRAPLRVVVSTNGTVEPIDDIEVRARFEGRVVEIPDPGKRVAAGEPMVRFDAGPVAAEVAAAESERLAALESLRVARATAAERRERLATDVGLFREGALTRDAFQASERAAAEADAQVRHLEREVPLRVAALEKRLEERRAQQAASVMRAPFAGTIYKTAVKDGALVRLGDPVLSLADLDRLRVRANVDQVDLGRVQPGQGVVISANAFPGRRWHGVITELVPNVVVKDSRSVADGLARLEPPTDGLVPGMTVDIEIIVAEASDVLTVPNEAVLHEGEQRFVYRVAGRRLRKTPVTTGLSSVAEVAITSGLEDGAVVVVGPTAGLADGMRVDPQGRAGDTGA